MYSQRKFLNFQNLTENLKNSLFNGKFEFTEKV